MLSIFGTYKTKVAKAVIALVEININEGFLDLRDGVIEGDHGAGDDRDVHHVPVVSHVGARV